VLCYKLDLRLLRDYELETLNFIDGCHFCGFFGSRHCEATAKFDGGLCGNFHRGEVSELKHCLNSRVAGQVSAQLAPLAPR